MTARAAAAKAVSARVSAALGRTMSGSTAIPTIAALPGFAGVPSTISRAMNAFGVALSADAIAAPIWSADAARASGTEHSTSMSLRAVA